MKQKLESASLFAAALLALTPFAFGADHGITAATGSSSAAAISASAGNNAVQLAKAEKEDDDDKDEKKGKKEGKEEKEEAEDDEETITLDKAPAAVQAAITKAIGDHKLEKLTKEEGEKEGKGEKAEARYEATFMDKGGSHTISFVGSGKIVEDEMEVKVSELPAAVTKAVMAKMPDAKISKAEKVTADGKTYFEVVIGEGKSKHELKVGEDGKMMKDEDKDEEHEHKGKDKDDDEKSEKEKK